MRIQDSPAQSLALAAASLESLGSVEGALAVATASLEDQRHATRSAEREARRAEDAAFEAQLDELESEATFTLLAGLGGAAGQIGSAATSLSAAGADRAALDADAELTNVGGASSPWTSPDGTAAQAAAMRMATKAAASTAASSSASAWAKVSEAGGAAQQATFGFVAASHGTDAKREAHRSEVAKRNREDARDADQELRAMRDKGMSHLGDIARARLEAQLAACRG
ncbi:MAG: hypothetical protein R3A78_06755 [Polyangiales bacterium]|nr:hypothetical protein [Myxococcales bacterium]